MARRSTVTLLEVLTSTSLDRAAYIAASTFFEAHARRIERDPSVREELVQIATIKLFKAIEQRSIRLDVHAEAVARRYLERLLENTQVDWIRKNKKRETAVEDIEQHARANEATAASDAAELDEDDHACIRAIDRAVVAHQPALAQAFEQISELHTVHDRTLAHFVDAALDEAGRKRERNRLQQQHSRWRTLMIAHARAAREAGEIDDDQLRTVQTFVLKVRQRSPMKKRSPVSATTAR
jgi:DNA-directed RNA polymerase specialized sigma24 family protein